MTLQGNFDKVMEQYTTGTKLIVKNRHPSSLHMLRVLAPNPNLQGDLADIAEKCWDLGINLALGLPDGPELTAGLRKLVEAKDCFVRAALDTQPVDYRDR